MLNSGFNKIKISVIETKQMMIGEAIGDVHQYIKWYYVVNSSGVDISKSEFYQDYIFEFDNYVKENRKVSKI